MQQSMLVEVAEDLRRRSDQIEPYFSTQRIVETCFPTALVTGRDLPPGVDEAVSETASGIVILYRRGIPTPSQRFVIAHALAHVIFDRMKGAARPGRAGLRSREERADRFAGELLLPLARLRDFVGCWPSRNEADHEKYLDQVDLIASTFQVPQKLVDKRIRELRAA